MIGYDEIGKKDLELDEQNKQKQEYEPSLEEKKLIKKLNQKFYKAKKKREKYDEKWADFYRFFRGKQWKFKRPSYRHSEVINLVFKVIQSFVPTLTDARPKFEYLPQDPTDREFAEVMSELAESDWVRNNWNNILVEVLYEQHIFGTGVSSLYYDPEKDNKTGAACYESVDVFTFFPSPDAKDTYRDCEFVITAQPMTIDLVKKKYPEKGKYVKPDMVDFEYLERSEMGDYRYKSPSNNFIYYDQERPADRGEDSHKAVIFTACFYDDETEDYEEQSGIDELGNPLIEVKQKLKYPQGRKVVWSGEVVLEDKPLAYEQLPYQKVQNYVLPREFWGISEVEQIEGPQSIYNKIYSFALDVLTLMGNPIWVIDNNSQVNQDALINKPGLVVTKVAGTEVRREEGVQLQPYVLQIMDTLRGEIDDLTGRTEASRGVRPAGITAAEAIRELQEAAQTRLRLKSRLIDCYLQTLGIQYADIVMNFYTIPKIYRITGRDGLDKYFKFYIEDGYDEQGNETKFAKIRNYSQNENGDYFMGEERTIPVKGKLDLRIVTGTSLPFARSEKETKILNYYREGLIDQEEALKAIDYPNYEAVMARMQEKQAMMAQMPQ